jgi:hypothetical protein
MRSHNFNARAAEAETVLRRLCYWRAIAPRNGPQVYHLYSDGDARAKKLAGW